MSLETLSIHFWNWDSDSSDEVYGLLNEMYTRGIYKQLHIKGHFDTTLAAGLLSVKGLVALLPVTKIVDLPPLESVIILKLLTEYHQIGNRLYNRGSFIYRDYHIEQPEKLARSLINLEEVHICNIDHIWPFIRFSSKLKRIAIGNSFENKDLKRKGISLVKMNREREILLTTSERVTKVTFYVPRHIYLSSRWRGEIDLNLIKMERFEMYKFVH